MLLICLCVIIFFFKQETASEMRMSDGSSDVCSSELPLRLGRGVAGCAIGAAQQGHGFQLKKNRHGGPERSLRRGEREGAAKAFGVWRQNDNLQVPHAGHPGSLGSLSVRNRKDIKSTISSLPALSSPKGTSARMVSRSEEHTSELQSQMRNSYA